MAVETIHDLQQEPVDAENPPSAPAIYPVARQAPGADNLNTIDIFGERPFSV
jgi:hypothetical protein